MYYVRFPRTTGSFLCGIFLLFQSEYLGEDGEWYFYYTGAEGATYNLTHVFYATEQDRVNIAKIQEVSLFVDGAFLGFLGSHGK